MEVPTLKIVSTDPIEQGEFVNINVDEFNELTQVLYVEPQPDKKS